MSNYIVLSLMARQHKDAEKLAARAEELLKELDPDDKQAVRFDLSKTPDGREEGIQYDGYAEEKIELAFNVIESVVATFPEMTLRYYMNSEGPLLEAGVSRNGVLVEIELRQTVVHLENTDDYQRVLTYLQGDPEIDVECSLSRCSPLSLGWEYDHQTGEEENDKRVLRLIEHFPSIKINCFKYNIAQEEHGDISFSVATAQVQDGRLSWNTDYSTEIKELLVFYSVRNVHGLSSYEDILFHSEKIPQSIKDAAHADAQPFDPTEYEGRKNELPF